MEAILIQNQEACIVADTLVDEVFVQFSASEQLHFDQEQQFESQLLNEVCKLLHVNKTHSIFSSVIEVLRYEPKWYLGLLSTRMLFRHGGGGSATRLF